MNTPPPCPNGSDCAASAARLNAIADRTAANYPSLAAELRRIASGIHSAEAQPEPETDANRSSA